MSTVFRLEEKGHGFKKVYANSGFDSVELGTLDEYGRLVVHDDNLCCSVSHSPEELEELAAFLRRNSPQQVPSLGEFDGTTEKLSTMDKIILHTDVDALMSPCKALLLFLNDNRPRGTAKSAECIMQAYNSLRPMLEKLIERGRKFAGKEDA